MYPSHPTIHESLQALEKDMGLPITGEFETIILEFQRAASLQLVSALANRLSAASQRLWHLMAEKLPSSLSRCQKTGLGSSPPGEDFKKQVHVSGDLLGSSQVDFSKLAISAFDFVTAALRVLAGLPKKMATFNVHLLCSQRKRFLLPACFRSDLGTLYLFNMF